MDEPVIPLSHEWSLAELHIRRKIRDSAAQSDAGIPVHTQESFKSSQVLALTVALVAGHNTEDS